MKEGSSAPFSVYDVSEALRAKAWLVPAYPMPEGMQDISVLRIVVRNGFSRDLASLFVRDLASVTENLAKRASETAWGAGAPRAGATGRTHAERTGFHH